MKTILGIIRGYTSLIIYMKHHGCDATALHHIDLAVDDPELQTRMRSIKTAQEELQTYIAAREDERQARLTG